MTSDIESSPDQVISLFAFKAFLTGRRFCTACLERVVLLSVRNGRCFEIGQCVERTTGLALQVALCCGGDGQTDRRTVCCVDESDSWTGWLGGGWKDGRSCAHQYKYLNYADCKAVATATTEHTVPWLHPALHRHCCLSTTLLSSFAFIVVFQFPAPFCRCSLIGPSEDILTVCRRVVRVVLLGTLS
jgi:hypothetical protein